MSGRDSLPHFPAPEKAQRPSSQSQGNMYQQGQSYQQNTSGVPGGYPAGGYQVGPPGTGYVAVQQIVYQPGYANQGSTSQPPAGVDPQLYKVFKAADTNNSGQLSELELSRALLNGDWTPFDAKTIKLMVNMFDADRYSPPRVVCVNGKVMGPSGWKNLSDYGDTSINGEDYFDDSIKIIRELLIVLNSAMHLRRLDIVFQKSLPMSSLHHMTKKVGHNWANNQL